LDADAQAYIAAVEAADGATLEAGVKWNIDQFVRGCKADGIWTAIKACCILSGARTLAGALVPLVGTAPTNFNFTSGDYNRRTGLIGDGASKYLNSNRAGNADPQNSNHHAVFVSTAPTSGSNYYPILIGHFGSGERTIYRDQNNGSYGYVCNGPTNGFFAGALVGFTGCARASSTAFTFRANATSNSVLSTSLAPFSSSIGVFASPNNLTFSRINGRLAFYSIGESLDLALLDTRISTLITSNALVIP
jgi:hypothetical protein